MEMHALGFSQLSVWTVPRVSNCGSTFRGDFSADLVVDSAFVEKGRFVGFWSVEIDNDWLSINHVSRRQPF